MKIVRTFLVIFPFFCFAQSKPISSTKPSLIENITSDTVNGKYNQIVFSYDKTNRVIGIINKEIRIVSNSSKKNKLIEKIIKEQTFEYKGTATQPFTRKTISFQFNKVDESGNKILFIESIERLYFTYNNGQRVGDSAILLINWRKEQDWDWKKAEPQKRIGNLEQTNKRIYHQIDITKPYSPPNIYSNEFILTPQQNINDETSAYRYANRSNDASYYRFSSFDTMLNPLKQLNIATTLVNEKIASEFGGQYGKTDINWYFFNQNNYIDYFVTTDEQSSHYKYFFKFSYTYNQFKQPTTAKAQIKQVFNNSGEFVQEYQQHFTFRYKK